MTNNRILILFVVLLALAPAAAMAGGFRSVGAVYSMSNDPEGNEIVVFDRDIRGRLTPAGAFATGGFGTGGGIDPLASQGSLVLSRNRHWLFAVNAGSDDISVFRVRRHYLELIGYYASGGAFPTSLACYHNLLFVLNAGQGGPANITGFRLNRHGELTPLADSTRPLPGSGFHQIGFGPYGDTLIVTKGGGDADEILVFPVDEDGLPAAAPIITPSAGSVPFGFIFDWRGRLLVAEAGSRALSAYALREDYRLDVISASVANGFPATCWIAGTWFGRVFTANTGGNNISAYKVRAANGALNLLEADAGSGHAPVDLATTRSGRYLYVLNAANGTIGAFHVFPSGRLAALGEVPGLPAAYAQGIAVR